MKGKLIGWSLPEAINEATREHLIRRGHLSMRHLWWARRRRAIHNFSLAQLVDGPSAQPDGFPTQEDQRVERALRHTIIERLVDTPVMPPPVASTQRVRAEAAKKSAAPRPAADDLNTLSGPGAATTTASPPGTPSLVERCRDENCCELEEIAADTIANRLRKVIGNVVRHIVSPSGAEDTSITLRLSAGSSEGFGEGFARSLRENSTIFGFDKIDLRDVES